MIDTELVLSILPDELKTETTIKGITSCGTKVGIDHCDNAFLTNKCWYDASPKVTNSYTLFKSSSNPFI